MPGSSYETLRYEVNSGIAEIILDRPPLNLIDRDSTLEYHAALKIADADSDVRVIIISGAGKGLSGGVDLKYLEKFESADMRDFLHLFYVETLQIIRGLNKPIIAAVHGYAREGACTLAFACDMIIAADDADFGYPGVPNLAGPPGMRAAELIFTGEPITAKEAERLGLITRMVPAAKLKQEVRALAAKIGSMSPLALKRTRDLLYQMEDMDFVDVPEAALSALADAFDSEDGREARRAFIEKRKAIWSGK